MDSSFKKLYQAIPQFSISSVNLVNEKDLNDYRKAFLKSQKSKLEMTSLQRNVAVLLSGKFGGLIFQHFKSHDQPLARL